MPEEEKISGRQFFFLVFCSLLSSALFGLPNVLISQAKQDAWLTILVGLGFAAIIALILYFLGLRYPNQTMFRYSETILGKYFGKLIGLTWRPGSNLSQDYVVNRRGPSEPSDHAVSGKGGLSQHRAGSAVSST